MPSRVLVCIRADRYSKRENSRSRCSSSVQSFMSCCPHTSVFLVVIMRLFIHLSHQRIAGVFSLLIRQCQMLVLAGDLCRRMTSSARSLLHRRDLSQYTARMT